MNWNRPYLNCIYVALHSQSVSKNSFHMAPQISSWWFKGFASGFEENYPILTEQQEQTAPCSQLHHMVTECFKSLQVYFYKIEGKSWRIKLKTRDVLTIRSNMFYKLFVVNGLKHAKPPAYYFKINPTQILRTATTVLNYFNLPESLFWRQPSYLTLNVKCPT